MVSKNPERIINNLSKEEPFEIADFIRSEGSGKKMYETYKNLPEFYEIQEDFINDIYGNPTEEKGFYIRDKDLGADVGIYHPGSDTYYGHEGYDEAEIGDSENVERYKKRMKALGYDDEQIKGVLEGYGLK